MTNFLSNQTPAKFNYQNLKQKYVTGPRPTALKIKLNNAH